VPLRKWQARTRVLWVRLTVLFLVEIYFTILILLFPFHTCSSFTVSIIRIQFYEVLNWRQVIIYLEGDIRLQCAALSCMVQEHRPCQKVKCAAWSCMVQEHRPFQKVKCAALSCMVQEHRPFQKVIDVIDLLTENAQENIRNRPAQGVWRFNPLNPELNSICYLLALLAHHFLHVSRIRVKSLTLRLLMSYIYGAPILDISRSHTTTQHSR